MLSEAVIREIYRQNVEMAAYFAWRMKSDTSQAVRDMYARNYGNAITLSLILEKTPDEFERDQEGIDVIEIDRRMKRAEEVMKKCENALSAEKTQTT